MSKEEKKNCNSLAALFYGMHGCDIPPGYDFSRATHPQEKSMWNLAEASFIFWKGLKK